ncbi:MAG: thioredoxin family protein [Candidatus Thorarchaeota archaeon]|jgi:thioredoxin 1
MSEEEDKDGFQFGDLASKLESALTDGTSETLANGQLNDLAKPEFMEEVRKAKTAIVMFYRTTCPFCKQLEPVLRDLAEDYESKVYFARVNVDEVTKARSEFKLLGVPVTIAFKKGTPVARVDGLKGTDDYDVWVESIHTGIRPMSMDRGPTSDVQ